MSKSKDYIEFINARAEYDELSAKLEDYLTKDDADKKVISEMQYKLQVLAGEIYSAFRELLDTDRKIEEAREHIRDIQLDIMDNMDSLTTGVKDAFKLFSAQGGKALADNKLKSKLSLLSGKNTDIKSEAKKYYNDIISAENKRALLSGGNNTGFSEYNVNSLYDSDVLPINSIDEYLTLCSEADKYYTDSYPHDRKLFEDAVSYYNKHQFYKLSNNIDDYYEPDPRESIKRLFSQPLKDIELFDERISRLNDFILQHISDEDTKVSTIKALMGISDYHHKRYAIERIENRLNRDIKEFNWGLENHFAPDITDIGYDRSYVNNDKQLAASFEQRLNNKKQEIKDTKAELNKISESVNKMGNLYNLVERLAIADCGLLIKKMSKDNDAEFKTDIKDKITAFLGTDNYKKPQANIENAPLSKDIEKNTQRNYNIHKHILFSKGTKDFFSVLGKDYDIDESKAYMQNAIDNADKFDINRSMTDMLKPVSDITAIINSFSGSSINKEYKDAGNYIIHNLLSLAGGRLSYDAMSFEDIIDTAGLLKAKLDVWYSSLQKDAENNIKKLRDSEAEYEDLKAVSDEYNRIRERSDTDKIPAFRIAQTNVTLKRQSALIERAENIISDSNIIYNNAYTHREGLVKKFTQAAGEYDTLLEKKKAEHIMNTSEISKDSNKLSTLLSKQHKLAASLVKDGMKERAKGERISAVVDISTIKDKNEIEILKTLTNSDISPDDSTAKLKSLVNSIRINGIGAYNMFNALMPLDDTADENKVRERCSEILRTIKGNFSLMANPNADVKGLVFSPEILRGQILAIEDKDLLLTPLEYTSSAEISEEMQKALDAYNKSNKIMCQDLNKVRADAVGAEHNEKKIDKMSDKNYKENIVKLTLEEAIRLSHSFTPSPELHNSEKQGPSHEKDLEGPVLKK